jgi:hypothetical protein
MVKSDPATVAKLLADDLSYFHSNGAMETKADVLKGITGQVKYTAIKFETTNVRQYGNTVITTHNVMFVTPTVSHHVFLTTYGRSKRLAGKWWRAKLPNCWRPSDLARCFQRAAGSACYDENHDA